MTMPHLMNCVHSDDGWCLDCVKKLWERADRLEASGESEPSQGETYKSDETGWVIERYINSELRYWTGLSDRDDSFLPNHEKAVRFARETDAMIVLVWLLKGHGRAAEHMWCVMEQEKRDGE
jgi:hypothetical protein